LSAGIQIMNRYDHYKRNTVLFNSYIQIIKLWERELGNEKLSQILQDGKEVE